MFVAALFVIAPNLETTQMCKRKKNKLGDICTMEYTQP